MQVIEGTWEEIKRHEAELTGRQVRLIIEPNQPAKQRSRTPVTDAAAVPTMKQLRGRGLFAGLLSTKEYLREKHEDTLREDRFL